MRYVKTFTALSPTDGVSKRWTAYGELGEDEPCYFEADDGDYFGPGEPGFGQLLSKFKRYFSQKMASHEE